MRERATLFQQPGLQDRIWGKKNPREKTPVKKRKGFHKQWGGGEEGIRTRGWGGSDLIWGGRSASRGLQSLKPPEKRGKKRDDPPDKKISGPSRVLQRRTKLRDFPDGGR